MPEKPSRTLKTLRFVDGFYSGQYRTLNISAMQRVRVFLMKCMSLFRLFSLCLFRFVCVYVCVECVYVNTKVASQPPANVRVKDTLFE